MNIRDRVKELRVVSAKDITPNPKNWRVHPESQKQAMSGVLGEIGFAAAAIARELPDGTVMLIDGHLRHELAEGGKLPVLVLDVTEDEADRLLLTLDPIKEMADADAAALQKLLDTIGTGSEAVAKLMEMTAAKAGLFADTESQDEAGETSDEPGRDDDEVLNGVRMVQLFLNETNIAAFHEACHVLGERYSTDNLTDTVLEAMRNAVTSL